MYSLRDCKNFAVGIVESHCDVTRYLDVLLLVGTYRHQIGFVNQNIRRLQNRIRKQAVIGTYSLCDLVLKADASLQQAHRRYARKKPGQFRNFRHIGLPPEDGFFRVQTQCDIIHHHIKRIFSQYQPAKGCW